MTTLLIQKTSERPPEMTPGASLQVPAPEAVAKTDKTSRVTLRPRPLWWLRRLIASVLCAVFLLQPWVGPAKLTASVFVLLLLGTGSEIEVDGERITRSSSLAFICYKTRFWTVAKIVRIEKEWEERGGLGEALQLGLYQFVIAPLCEWLMPWTGGPYQIRMRLEDGHSVQLWRGRRGRSFQRNLKLLSQTTGLPQVQIWS